MLDGLDGAPAGSAPTGSDLTDRALGRLADLEGHPVEEHVAVLGEVHRLLQDALAALDEA